MVDPRSLTDDFFDWIDEHSTQSPYELSLRCRGQFDNVDFAITQIECRQKARKKLASVLSSRRFLFPHRLSEEQSTAEDVAFFHSRLIPRGGKVLDLTAGLGIDCFALSDRASSIVALDIDKMTACVLDYNAEVLGKTNVVAICSDCVEYLKRSKERYDVVFADPARRDSHGGRVFAIADCSPNIVDLLPSIELISERLIVKLSPMLDIKMAIAEMNGVSDVYVVGNKKECKELLLVKNFKTTSSHPVVHAVSIDDQLSVSSFDFTFEDEYLTEASYGDVDVNQFLYEPSPSMFKSQPFNLISRCYGIDKLSRLTHLYVSPHHVSSFQGAVYEVVDKYRFNKSAINAIRASYDYLNIKCRNFPLSANELEKQMKITTGGDFHLFAITALSGEKQLIIGRQIEG